MKSEGVKDIVKWFEGKIKEQQAVVERAERDNLSLGMYEDCGDYYRENLAVARAKLDILVSVKISTEKYMKKLRHEEAEAAAAAAAVTNQSNCYD